MSEIDIRAMSRTEIDMAVDWAAAEGWNPGIEDVPCFAAEDPNGFMIATVGGEPAAVISVIRYGTGFGFLGFYIAAPEFRGRGLGMRLWTAGMARLEGRLVGLDGVVDQQANYAKSGFVLAHRNIRHGGSVHVDQPADSGLVAITPSMVDTVTAFDRAFFPAPRDRFVACWLSGETRIGRALVDDGTMRGYGLIRRCRHGFKIGPLFADTADGADLLFRSLAAETGGEELFLDTPEPNAEAVALARRYGLTPVFETARMYRGPDPGLPLDRTFGITTFELG